MTDCLLKNLIAENTDVILKANKIGRRPQSVPLVESIVSSLNHGIDDKEAVDDRGREQKGEDRDDALWSKADTLTLDFARRSRDRRGE